MYTTSFYMSYNAVSKMIKSKRLPVCLVIIYNEKIKNKSSPDL